MENIFNLSENLINERHCGRFREQWSTFMLLKWEQLGSPPPKRNSTPSPFHASIANDTAT